MSRGGGAECERETQNEMRQECEQCMYASIRGEKKSLLSMFQWCFFLILALCALKGREEGKDLTVLNKGDLHKPGSGSPAAVVNEKATASRQPH